MRETNLFSLSDEEEKLSYDVPLAERMRPRSLDEYTGQSHIMGCGRPLRVMLEGGKVPMKQLIKDLLSAYKYGLKTLYYHNTRDGADDVQQDLQDDGCAGGACKI